jgi:pimeloyl-ACP methyl ester carboxylesterase
MRYSFATKDFVKKIDAPTYLFVSKADEIAYIESARELEENIKNLSYYKEFDVLTHKELLWDEHVIKTIKEVMKV